MLDSQTPGRESIKLPLVNVATLLSHIENKKALQYKSSYISEEYKLALISLTSQILLTLHKEKLAPYFSYIVSEMIDNAQKANVRKIYFNQNKIDTTVNEQFLKALKLYYIDFRENFNKYLTSLESNGFFTEIIFQPSQSEFTFQVNNFGVPCEYELTDIESKFLDGNKLEDTAEGYFKQSGRPDGCGMGIITIMTLLKKIGLGEHAFKFSYNTEKNFTSFYAIVSL